MPGPDSFFRMPGIGTVAQLWNLARTTPDGNSTIDTQIRLAREAGYSGTRPQLIAIGQGLLSADAFALGQGGGPGADRVAPGRQVVPVPAAPPPFYPPTNPAYQPPPPGSGGSGSSGRPPPPPPRPTPTPGINPNAPAPGAAFPSMWPYVIGQVAGPSVLDAILRANQYATGFFNVITGAPQPPIAKGPTNPRRVPPEPKQPLPPPYNVILQQPAARVPRSERVAAILGQLGGDIYVTPKRLPVPKPPKAPRPAAPPAPRTPIWLQLLPIIGPSLLGSVGRSQGGTRITLRDPLTQPQLGGLTSSQTLVQSYFSGGSSSGAGTGTCECAPKRKKGRKKKRTVCYSGTYTEKASGLRKSKKRKVPCQ